VKLSLFATLPVLAFTLALGPNRTSDAPPNVGSAIAEQRTLVAERPGEAGVWNDLGNLLVLEGGLDEAESAYAKALELDPASVQARFNLGLLRQQRGDLDGAVVEYRELLEIDPEHAWAHYQLGAAYETQGERELALEHYAEAFTLDPELLFAETNPHIIENGLVTEALLRRRGSRSAPPAPRAYDEPARIQSILTPPPTAHGNGAPKPADAEEQAAPAADAEAAPVNAHREQAARAAGPHAHATSAHDPNRVLTSTDLHGGTRNQVNGDAEGAPTAPNTRRRSSAAVTPQGRHPVSQQPLNDPTHGFGVGGQRSTGSLEWKLGPETDQPVPAR